MSCKGEASSGSTIKVSGKNSGIKELIKAGSIEEANRLLNDGHVFLSVYWNTKEAHEEYILGKLGTEDKPDRQVGFLREK